MVFKLLDLNIWKGTLVENAIAFIVSQNPDIIMLQEVFHNPNNNIPEQYKTYERLKSQLNYAYSNFVPTHAWKESTGTIEGKAIFSRFPIVYEHHYFIEGIFGLYEHTEENFLKLPLTIQNISVSIHGKNVSLYNFHGIWGTHGNDTSQRIRMAKKILTVIDAKQPMVLAGDFNCNPNTQTVHLIEKVLLNVFDNSLSSTFNMKRKANPGYAKAAVDMMFISKDIHVLKKTCPQVDISDHLPLIVELEI